MTRGKLRIYLGAAPGVGKTYAMLSEAHRRTERGTDCVVAFVEHHHRPRTEVMPHGLEQAERREPEYRDTSRWLVAQFPAPLGVAVVAST
ncbi:hypothetical protein GCM10010339_95030 [Streptomyces alanosinicus]|uniref:Signal transduction histidine kinase osmosensitive K+ channel sensor N-terminal domain-containing protein n=1 Tax=Streptomyces alanosinicus TaxID=68171 RepID=A0A918MIN7_9ACTN|nr:hypothetical protein GCM10010339_95030 [Streptomyces alanosinicus]